jgi:hypothetical protein
MNITLKKSALVAILVLIATVSTFAQLKVSLNISPHPDPYLSNWSKVKNTVIVTITNSGASAVNAKFDCKINLDGVLLVNTKQESMRTLTLPPGVSQFFGEDLVPYESVKITGNADKTAIRTGMLPGGFYEFCVSLIHPQTQAQLTLPVCKNFTMMSYQSPVLIQPEDKSMLGNSKRPMLRWTAVSPKYPTKVSYRIAVFEVLTGQNPMLAIRINRPIIDKTETSIQMLWPSDVELPKQGMQYVWSVQSLDEKGTVIGEKEWAEPFTFKVNTGGNLRSTTADSDPNNTGNSGSSGTGSQSGTTSVGQAITAGQNGEFSVLVTQLTTESDGSLTGKGKVYIQWLMTNVAVEFKKIQINSASQLTSGGIVTTESGSSSTSYQAYPKAWALSLLSGPGVANAIDNLTNWTNNQVDNIISYVNTNVNLGQPTINYQSNIAPPPIPDNSLKMPFGLQFNNGNQQLVITEMIFKPNESKINFLTQHNFTKNGTDYKLGFTGKYFIFHPNSIEFANGRVDLAEDITIPNSTATPKMEFTFKQGTTSGGCYVQWANSGITDISLGLEVSFTRDWLIPIPSTTPTSKVVATLAGNGTSMQDILLTGNLPNCEIVGTNGLKIMASQMALDLSDTRNPSNIIFPENYPGNTGVDWTGFYIGTFSVTMPNNWRTGTNLSPPSVTASNFIIDDMGLTTKITAINIFNLQSGTVANLSASLDEVEISIISSSLVSGTAKGLVVLPISNVTLSNTLKYTATFAQANSGNSFQVVIVPYQAIDANVLKGKMTLNPTSNITVAFTPGVITASLSLNGVFDWSNPDLSTSTSTNTGSSPPTRPGGIKGVKMELAFESVGLTYINNSNANTNTLTFNYGNWSFASPQKRLSNFPVTIKNIYYKSLSTVNPTSPAGQKELLRGALMIDIVANLTEDIGGSTSVGAAFAVEFNTNTLKFTPKFKGVFIEKIAVHADLSAVKIDGLLEMYDSDPIFGDGFKATLGVTFTAVSLQINALAQFGNTTWNNNNQYYRYWRVEADVKLPVGIPFLTGVGFYGFGGGAFYNMKANSITSIADPGNTAYTFEPKKSTLGFMVKATVGTIPKFETFNTDVSLMAQFSSTGGITNISFLGNFWLAAKLNERPAAKIKGSVVVSYNFPDKIFYMAAGLLINVPPAITTPSPIGFVMNIDGRTNKWYFKAGTPTDLNTVNVFGVSLYSYFMFGNDIPQPNGFTTKFSDNYFTATGSYPNSNNVATGGVGNDTKTGKGIATGIGIEFNKDLYYSGARGPLCCKRDWAVSGNISAGAELNLAFMQQNGCEGINGYRASGGLGLYASCELGVTGTPSESSACGHDCDVERFTLFSIHCGMWCTGKFPNPEYVAGALDVNVEAMDGLISVHTTKYFEKGTDCQGTAVTDTNAAQEDKASDLKNRLIQYIAPNTRYSFPANATINVKYSLVPDQIFDIAENQGDGTIKNRTFKMVVTKSLEVYNSGAAWVAKMLLSKVNNLGEYQYAVAISASPYSNTGTQSMSTVSQSVGSLSQSATTFSQTSTSTAPINTNSGNLMIGLNGLFTITNITSPLPPPPPPNYPNPTPNPVNHLEVDKDYRFVVTATLQELIGGTWRNALTRAGVVVSETKTQYFRTGAMHIVNTVR